MLAIKVTSMATIIFLCLSAFVSLFSPAFAQVFVITRTPGLDEYLAETSSEQKWTPTEKQKALLTDLVKRTGTAAVSEISPQAGFTLKAEEIRSLYEREGLLEATVEGAKTIIEFLGAKIISGLLGAPPPVATAIDVGVSYYMDFVMENQGQVFTFAIRRCRVG